MKVRFAARMMLMTIGFIHIVLFVVAGFADLSNLFGGAVMIFISATNFCSQCPLLNAVLRLIRRPKRKEIPVVKL